ncbi:MAG: hypothetical protein ABI683_08960 [Ginsengibacter sp.]
MRFLILTAVSLTAFFIQPNIARSQSVATTNDSVAIKNALNIYHQYMSPESNLYDGSEYTYNTYYPFIINEGDPFFFSKNFDTGSVYYNGIVYEKVPLLYDIIHGEVLIRDPSQINVVRLNDKYIGWFTIYGHTFTKLIKDSTSANPLNTGFYAALYKGRTSLYKSVSKIFKENSASFQGLNKYTVETDEYFVKKNNDYFRIKNKKSLLKILGDRKKDINQYMKKNKLKFKKAKEYTLIKVVAYYDQLTANN